MKKRTTRGLALVLNLMILLSSMPMQAAAAGEPAGKEEVVYINLLPDGQVDEVNVVNILDVGEAGNIRDYGDYTSVRNMTGTSELFLDKGMITAEVPAGKLYYEGKLEEAEIPWNIRIHYFMNGQEYTASEIAGMSGQLRITLDITENEKCSSDFFAGFALQTSLSLDTEKCWNIECDGATVANVGSQKQLTYTILPGKGANIEITAQVTDFEMDGISINGIPLNLNIEIDDEELMEQVNELLDAIEQLDDGAGELYDGADALQTAVSGELQNGASDLTEGAEALHAGAAALVTGGASVQSGTASLHEGAVTLDQGAQTLNGGIAQMQSGLNALSEKSGNLTAGSEAFYTALTQLQTAVNGFSTSGTEVTDLVDASSNIKTGIGSIVSNLTALQAGVSAEAYRALMLQNGLDIDALETGNTDAIAQLNEAIGQVAVLEGIAASLGIPTESLQPLEEQYIALANQLIGLMQANNANIAGMDSYLSTANSNITVLLNGATTLQTSYADFDAAIGTLSDQLTGMVYQLSGLNTAVNTLVSEYEKLDTGVSDYTDGVAQIVAGYAQVVSGSSALVSGSGALCTGTQTLYSGTSELLSGIVEIYDGSGTLRDGAGKLDDGVAELLTGVVALYDGAGEMKDGTAEMREETSGMDEEIDEKIDTLISSVTGSETEIVSFVSEKNTNVTGVQFVMQTEKIEMPEEPEKEPEEEQPASFGQKLLALFGF